MILLRFVYIVIIFSIFACTEGKNRKNKSGSFEKKKENLINFDTKSGSYVDFLLDSLRKNNDIDTFFFHKKGSINYCIFGDIFERDTKHFISIGKSPSSSLTTLQDVKIYYITKNKWKLQFAMDSLESIYGLTVPLLDGSFVKYQDINQDGYKDFLLLNQISVTRPYLFWFLWIYNPKTKSFNFINHFEKLTIPIYCEEKKCFLSFYKDSINGFFSIKEIKFLKNEAVLVKNYEWQSIELGTGYGKFSYQKARDKEKQEEINYEFQKFKDLVLKHYGSCVTSVLSNF